MMKKPKRSQRPAGWTPHVQPTAVVVPQGDGQYLVRVGKPAIMPEEIGTRDAARILGLSQRQVQALVDAGAFAHVSRPGSPRGKYLLSRAEVLARKQTYPAA